MSARPNSSSSTSNWARGNLRVDFVVGGYFLGAAWVAAMAAAFNTMRVDRGRRPVHVTEGLEPEQAPRLTGDTTGDQELDHSQ
jgi:hypothetical protein